MNNRQSKKLVEGAKLLGRKAGKKEVTLLNRYTDELLLWSQRMNLTGYRDRESIEVFHYLDSISLFQTGLISAGQSVMDVGSGAGFPGLPLKIFEPTLDLTLLEASEKRGTYLRYMVRTLELSGVEVVVARAEEFGREAERTFQRILSRATASITKICTWTLPLLEEGGFLILQKSRRVHKEVRECRGALEEMGLEIREVMPLSVPFIDASRYAVIIEKKLKSEG